MEVSTSEADADSAADAKKEVAVRKEMIPEVLVYIKLMVVILLIDSKMYEMACTESTKLINEITSFNRRTLDQLAAKAYFYYSRRYHVFLPHGPALTLARLFLLSRRGRCAVDPLAVAASSSTASCRTCAALCSQRTAQHVRSRRRLLAIALPIILGNTDGRSALGFANLLPLLCCYRMVV